MARKIDLRRRPHLLIHHQPTYPRPTSLHLLNLSTNPGYPLAGRVEPFLAFCFYAGLLYLGVLQ